MRYPNPRVGGTWHCTLATSAPSSTAALVLGVGRQDVDLTPFGVANCSLLVHTVVATVAMPTDASGRASLSVPLANDPTLAGDMFNARWFALDPGASSLDLSGSDAVETLIGSARGA